MEETRLNRGVAFLADKGFNLFSITASRSLPETVKILLQDRGVELTKFPSLILIGSGGKRLWEALHEEPADPMHPVNSFTEKIINHFIRDHLENPATITLFPSSPSHRLGIQSFVHWLGLGHPTPLGKNIHHEYGLWHAYRAAFLTTLSLPEAPRDQRTSPCAVCVDKPCIKACPSSAVGEVKQTLMDFDRMKCFTFRLKEKSICSDRCISRMACPVGREHRYTMAQMKHHYSCSRQKIIEQYNTNNQYGLVTA